MSDDWKSDAQHRESLMVFSGFTAQDEGRSRVNVAICSTPENAAFIVRAANSHYALVEACKAAQRELAHGGDHEAIEKLEAALKLAEAE